MTGHNKAIGGGGFHHVAMRSRDFDASVKFYTEVLGFCEVMSWGAGDRRAVMLDTGDGSCLEIFAGGDGAPKPEGTLLHFALKSDDCDAAAERVRRAGAPITVEPNEVTIESDPPRRVRLAFCEGPDGEVIEFFQQIG